MRTYIVSNTECRTAHLHTEDCTYRVAWAINPHMRIGETSPERARAQHAGLVRALRHAGAQVRELGFVHGAFDCVFMKDSVVLAARGDARGALPATFRCEERMIESASRSRALAQLGFTVAPSLAVPLEGGDICVVEHRRIALLGHGVRSSRDAAPGLAAFLGYEVHPLELRDPALFHLDTALTVLPDDTLVYCPDAFTPAALATLRGLRFARTHEVTSELACTFGLNVVPVGATLVTGTSTPALWEALDLPAIYTPLDQFQLAGGSAACLVAEVHDLEAQAARLAA